MENKKIELKPVISEKSYNVANAQNKYVFLVPADLNRIEVAREVEAQYKVKVEKVNIVTRPGKMRKDWRTYRTYRAEDLKKAVVTVKKGDKIDEFFTI